MPCENWQDTLQAKFQVYLTAFKKDRESVETREALVDLAAFGLAHGIPQVEANINLKPGPHDN